MQKHHQRLEGKVAVVTGGAGGIGSATVRLFAEHGASVVVVDIQEKPARDLICRLTEKGMSAVFTYADITNPQQVRAVHDRVMAEFGHLDIIVHSAGISGRPLGDGPVTECPEETWDKVIRTNLTGAYLVSKYLVPPMLAARSGSVVHIASDDAISIPRPPHDTHAYIASKGGVIALTRAMAISYAPYGVRVNAVAPGWVASPMTDDLKADPAGYQALIDRHPLGRLGTPEDIAAAALFLAGDESSFVTGQVLPVEGGATVW